MQISEPTPNAMPKAEDTIKPHFSNLLPILLNPNFSTPLEFCCFAKPSNPTIPAFLSSLYLLNASLR